MHRRGPGSCRIVRIRDLIRHPVSWGSASPGCEAKEEAPRIAAHAIISVCAHATSGVPCRAEYACSGAIPPAASCRFAIHSSPSEDARASGLRRSAGLGGTLPTRPGRSGSFLRRAGRGDASSGATAVFRSLGCGVGRAAFGWLRSARQNRLSPAGTLLPKCDGLSRVSILLCVVRRICSLRCSSTLCTKK